MITVAVLRMTKDPVLTMVGPSRFKLALSRQLFFSLANVLLLKDHTREIAAILEVFGSFPDYQAPLTDIIYRSRTYRLDPGKRRKERQRSWITLAWRLVILDSFVTLPEGMRLT